MKPVWVKCLLGSLAGGVVGITLAVAHVLVRFLWLHPPHFKNDSEAMVFPFIFLGFVIGEAIIGATIGAISGSIITLWRLQHRKLALAVLLAGAILCAISIVLLWIGAQQARR